MRTTTALDWSWGHTTPSQSVPSTVGTRRGKELTTQYFIMVCVGVREEMEEEGKGGRAEWRERGREEEARERSEVVVESEAT